MNLNITVSDADVLETKEDISKFFKTNLADNFNKMVEAFDATKLSAALGYDSNKKWDEFVAEVTESVEKQIDKASAMLAKESKVEEENPDNTEGTNESVEPLTFKELLEKYSNE